MTQLTFIGDIHSAADDLRALLQDPVVAASRLIFLGDYIDGNPQRQFRDHVERAPLDPLGVLRLVRERVDQHGDVALLGNHDAFWTETARWDTLQYQTWKLNGGSQTWRRLGIHATSLPAVAAALSDAPLKDLTDWLAARPLSWQNAAILAVHAGIDWDRPLAQQRDDDLMWIRDDYYFASQQPDSGWHANDLGKVIVTGHTPVQVLAPGRGYLKLQATPQDVPRYLIDAGSRSGAFDGGVGSLTLTAAGTVVQAKRAIKGRLYDGDQLVTEAMVAAPPAKTD